MPIEEERYCQNPRCGRPLTIVRGHRHRQYCDDVCKQAAHRARVVAARLAEEEAARLARIEHERQALLKRWGNLLPETVDLLHTLPASLVECIVPIIRAEQEQACKTALQERDHLIESLLLAGEQLGFPVLANDDFRLEAGVEQWLAFCHEASLEALYLAHDLVRIKLTARAGRERLAVLSLRWPTSSRT